VSIQIIDGLECAQCFAIRSSPVLGLFQDEGLKIVGLQVAIAKKRREVVWSRATKVRWFHDTGIEGFASLFFTTSRADYLSRYDNEC
jgi:hypothetical protein